MAIKMVFQSRFLGLPRDKVSLNKDLIKTHTHTQHNIGQKTDFFFLIFFFLPQILLKLRFRHT